MRIISWVWFLYVMTGFAMASALACVLYIAKEKAIKISMPEWAGIVTAELMFMFMIQTFIGSIQEYAMQAAWLTIVFMGIPLAMVGVATMRSMQKKIK